MLQQDNFVTS